MGWDRNAKGMFGPKYVDLSKTMDPKKLVYLRLFTYVIFIYKLYVLDERKNL